MVSQVLDPLPVTPLPYAPSDVEGLVNVTGAVLLKVNLAVRLGQAAPSSPTSGNLLVVMTGHESIALQVDRVYNKVSQDESLIKFYDNDQQHPLIQGEFTLGDSMVLLLNEAALGLQEMQPEGVPEDGGGLIGALSDVGKLQAAEAMLSDLPTVTVEDGAETYALHMPHVQEIVEMGALTDLPGSGPEVMGLMKLRGQALMVLSLARLLGRNIQAAPRFVLVVSMDTMRIGLSVANILGIERYTKEDVQNVSGGDSQLEGYLPGGNARPGHMTGLLSIEGLVTDEGMAQYQRYMTQQASLQTEFMDQTARSTRRVLTFRLGAERCALALNAVDRVEEFRASVDLPEGDASLTGAIQIKGEIAPVLDMRTQLGLTPLETSSYVIVRIEGAPWALVVDKIERVIEIPEKDISPVRTHQSDYLTEVGRVDGELISLLTLAPLVAATQAH